MCAGDGFQFQYAQKMCAGVLNPLFLPPELRSILTLAPFSSQNQNITLVGIMKLFFFCSDDRPLYNPIRAYYVHSGTKLKK